MEPYDISSLKTTHGLLVKEHAKLMQDIQRLDDKKELRLMQREIDLLYKCIIDINKLLGFFREKDSRD
jgi:hypothetical protein